MAQDDDWLAREIAASQSPFQTFQRPDSPFGAPDPGADSVYTTRDVNNIQAHQGRSNPLKSAFGWLKGLVPHGEETAPRQSLPDAMAEPKPVSFGQRIADVPARALNVAAGVPDALLHSGEHYAGWQGHRMGEFDPLAVAVPPQAMAAFMPGLRGKIAAGEANPISTYDKVRAHLNAKAGDEKLAPFASSRQAELDKASGSAAESGMARRTENPIDVYHGSPHDFDRFDASKIGTGEGAQAYGHGLYFAENPKVAADYRKNLSNSSSRPFMEYTVRLPHGGELKMPSDKHLLVPEGSTVAPELHHAVNLIYWDSPAKAKALTKQWLQEAKVTGEGTFPGRDAGYYQRLYDHVRQIRKSDIGVTKGRTYEARLHADKGEFLNWESPLSKQSDHVREVLRQPVLDLSAERARLAELEAMRPFNDTPAHSRASREYIELLEAIGEGDPKGSSVYRRAAAQNEGRLVRPIEAERDAMDSHGRWGSWNAIKDAQGKADRLTADAFSDAGIPGVRYWDQKSRSRKNGTSNYVVFPKAEDIIEFSKKYAKPGVALPAGRRDDE